MILPELRMEEYTKHYCDRKREVLVRSDMGSLLTYKDQTINIGI